MPLLPHSVLALDAAVIVALDAAVVVAAAAAAAAVDSTIFVSVSAVVATCFCGCSDFCCHCDSAVCCGHR